MRYILSIFFCVLLAPVKSYADYNVYVTSLYDRYKEKEKSCVAGSKERRVPTEELLALKRLKPEDVNAYAVKKGIDHNISCTSTELAEFLHAGWAAHRISQYNEHVKNVDYLIDGIIDNRYLPAIIRLSQISKDVINELDDMVYFQGPFDIEYRPWEKDY